MRSRSSTTWRRASSRTRSWTDAAYARRFATAIPASSAAAPMNGIRSNPPPVIRPNGLKAAVAAISTATVARASAAARQTLTWTAT